MGWEPEARDVGVGSLVGGDYSFKLVRLQVLLSPFRFTRVLPGC